MLASPPLTSRVFERTNTNNIVPNFLSSQPTGQNFLVYSEFGLIPYIPEHATYREYFIIITASSEETWLFIIKTRQDSPIENRPSTK